MPAAGPKYVFLHLLSMATLYLSAIHLGTILFQLINYWFTDALDLARRGIIGTTGPLRWAIAMLVVVFPVYFGVSRHLHRAVLAAPELLGLRTRRWFYAFTLFAAILIAIGDLVAVLYNFLEGELSIRFLLKALVILILTAAIATYYRWEFQRAPGAPLPARERIIAWSVVVVTIAATVTGFMVAGLPESARDRRFDERRVGDLQNIQWQLVQYWQQKGTLPANLLRLNDSISGYAAPLDPIMQSSYEYRMISPLTFELCATFATASDASPTATSYAPTPARMFDDPSFQQWAHPKGRSCFTRTIDPDRYPPSNKPLSPK